MADRSRSSNLRRFGRAGVGQVVAFFVGLAIVVGIFAFAVPRFADYGAVWDALQTLTPIELWSLLAATVFNLFTYWWANMAALPGLRLWPSAVVTQTGTSIANTLPAGGAVAVGVTYAQLNSWGFTGDEAALFVGVSGLWNIFAKLMLPLVSLGLLVATGSTYPALVGVAALGIVVLAVAVALLVLLFRSERLARRIGDGLGRGASAVLRPFRRGPITGLGERAVVFRRESVLLVRRRWIWLTLTTLLGHLALWFVLVLSLRHMGVDAQELPTVEILAVFSFSRLLSALPITPGGVGVIDLGYIAGLIALDQTPGSQAQIVAGVLLFRLLTFGIQIPLGGVTYLIWRAKKSWMRDTPPPGSVAAELDAAGQLGSAVD
ncbi:MAG TPA: lysylphosphatidylglycerol synthase domain-containing protein [Actinomycetota bacterium]